MPAAAASFDASTRENIDQPMVFKRLNEDLREHRSAVRHRPRPRRRHRRNHRDRRRRHPLSRRYARRVIAGGQFAGAGLRQAAPDAARWRHRRIGGADPRPHHRRRGRARRRQFRRDPRRARGRDRRRHSGAHRDAARSGERHAVFRVRNAGRRLPRSALHRPRQPSRPDGGSARAGRRNRTPDNRWRLATAGGRRFGYGNRRAAVGTSPRCRNAPIQ